MGSWIIYLPVDDRTGWKLSGKAGKLRKVPAKFLPIAAHDDRLTRPVSAEQAAIAVEHWLVGPGAVTEISWATACRAGSRSAIGWSESTEGSLQRPRQRLAVRSARWEPSGGPSRLRL